jgi:hypothetical protein
MSSPGPEEYPFEVIVSGVIATAIRRLQGQASGEGRGEAFLRAIRQVGEQLRRDPWQAGEPLYRLAGLRLQVRCIAVRPLYVDFAVHENQPLVFLKAVRLFSLQEP